MHTHICVLTSPCFIVGVDETVVVTLKFSQNRMAVFTCSSGMQLPNDAIIVGTKGTIQVSKLHEIKKV